MKEFTEPPWLGYTLDSLKVGENKIQFDKLIGSRALGGYPPSWTTQPPTNYDLELKLQFNIEF